MRSVPFPPLRIHGNGTISPQFTLIQSGNRQGKKRGKPHLLLLKWLQHQSHLSWSFSNLATMLRLNLFTYRDLLEWLIRPFGPPAQTTAGDLQLVLPLP